MAGNDTSGSGRTTSRRGFAVMDKEKQRAIAAKGGRSQGKENNSGNFANNREKARAAGRKGGQASHGSGSKRSDATDETTEEE
jgi:hypothetical protein